jgi:hypothetical protein
LRSGTLRPEEELLVLATRLDLSPAVAQRLDTLLGDSLDWSWLQQEAALLRAEPLLYRQLSEPPFRDRVPAEAQAAFARAYQLTCLKNLQLYGTLRRLLLALEAERLPAILLKGAFLAQWIYGDIGLRPMGDLDLLFRKEDEDRLGHVLDRLGYDEAEPAPEGTYLQVLEHTNHGMPRFLGKITRLEPHFFLLARHCPDPDRLQHLIWDRVLVHDWEGLPVRSLSWEFQVLHLAAHLHEHVEKSAIFLYWLSDLRALLHRHGGDLDWPWLGAKARELGLELACLEVFDLLGEPWRGDGEARPRHRAATLQDVLTLSRTIRAEGEPRLPLYRDALLAARHAGGLGAQASYLFRLVVPPWRRMAQRHPAAGSARLLTHYLLDPLVRIGRLAKGLGQHVRQRSRH